MTIRGLENYLRERKLFQTAPLSALTGTRIGIDANYYIRTLLQDPDQREPLIASTGGIPLSLANRIELDLRQLDKAGIKPVFVFSGLPLATRPPGKGPNLQAERENVVKNEAWTFYEDGQVDRAVVALTQSRGGVWVEIQDLLRTVLRLFKHRFVEYVIAPYMAQAQLAYLLKHPRGYIHAVWSDPEILLWNVEKVITTIDWSGTFTFIDKLRVLQDLVLTPDQFLDMALLSGCSISRTFPPISDNFQMRAAIDIIRQYKTGIVACQSWREPNQQLNQPQPSSSYPSSLSTSSSASVNTGSGLAGGQVMKSPPTYSESFMRARLAVKYALVFTTDGACLPLPLVIPPPGQQISHADVPSDLEEIFSLRLPDELYFAVCRGMVSAQLIGWLTSGIIDERQPLADSSEYRRFIKDIITEGPTSPRCTTLALLTASLHPHWSQRRVMAYYYFDLPNYAAPHGTPVPFTDPLTQSLVEKCSTWMVDHHLIADELRRQNSSTIDMKLCIETLDKPDLATRTNRPKNGSIISPMDKKDQIVANVIWRFLDVRGFVTNTHQHTIMGKAYSAACRSYRVTDKFQEPLYVLLELLRAGVVHGHRFGGPDAPALSGGPSFGSEDEQVSTLLIMRVLSVVPLNFRPEQWSGPLSRELLVFNSFVKATTKSLRYLLEAIHVHLLLSGDGKRARDDYLEMCISLPFQQDVNTGFGILAKTYLDAAIFHYEDAITEDNVGEDKVKVAKKNALEFVETAFTGVKAPVQEVERGFRFWDAVMVAVRTLNKEQGPTPTVVNTVIQPEVMEQFEKADKWLKIMRP